MLTACSNMPASAGGNVVFQTLSNQNIFTTKHEPLRLMWTDLTFLRYDGYSPHLLPPSFVCLLVNTHPLPGGTGSDAGGGELYLLMMS